MMSLCQVCSSQPFKYRCPACDLQSCSLNCSQAHKPNCNPRPVQSLQTNYAQNEISTAGSVGETREISQDSGELQELFNQHPTLRSRLRDIHRITLEEEWIEMGRSIQSRSRGRGRDGYGQRPMNRGPWTIEKGFKRGLGRVRKWRESCEAGSGGADGAAFMRFIALVLGEDGAQPNRHQTGDFT
ncbi:HIT zinc finger family protein [Coccidioides posadasii C735 delta SOWgp]|uniref:HIT zinc finger family protein n=1 Tax=Coccidioides posadasii (strain C735) TaxID=222929 RepID=C5P0N6_COCP7|nr:HIT zinc finger family protein [Coccidioides posadasii C735 delta SOWgp]EER29244.1 HIT zinc finger family protein [Coccidioides posadasii C735 delta SOWgp]|eukprot:XP_003071389.1 HIT zinc finger family protein [Coccidioides posadasii C735 delta SOWgp]